MGEPGRNALLLTGAFVAILGFAAGLFRLEPPLALELPPAEVGRSLAEVQKGLSAVDAARPLAPPPGAPDPLLAFVAGIPAAARAAPFRGVVFHPFEAELPQEAREEGPPWHLVIDRGGALEWTARGAAGRPGGPSWMAVGEARTLLHVALPAANESSAERAAALFALRAWLAAEKGISAAQITFSDEHAGGPALPQGFQRDVVRPGGLR